MKHTSTSEILKVVYHFKGFQISGKFLTEKELKISLKKIVKTGLCPKCKTHCRNIEASFERTIRDIDFVDRKTDITFREYKIKCRCGYRGIEHLDFIDKCCFYTKRFEKYVALLCEKMTVKNAAGICRINWKTAKNIDKKTLSKLKVDLKDLFLTRIGIDEVAYEKGHKYLTIVRELEENKVIWIGIGRKKETLDAFFIELGKEKAACINVAVMDMWDAYIASVKEHCPNAAIVFDKFHVSKKVNEALDAIRKSEFRKADPVERINMKRKRFLILRRRKNLEDDQKETVENLKQINAKLYEAYLIKEQILDIFDESDPLVAMRRIIIWIANVREAGLTAFEAVINTILNYLYGIMNYFRYKVTNAGAEAVNNKINVIKRMAYGFHDIEYFKLKILQSCGWRSS
jgi:transposase